MKLRYFDHNATTPLAEVAKTAWLQAVDTQWLNPSSPYRQAAAVRVRYEAARASLAELLGVGVSRVVFTAGATEANNAVFRHWGDRLSADARVGVNPTEHPSVLEAAKAFLGERVLWLPLLEDGRVDLNVLEQQIQSGALTAVSVMAANNETGVIQAWPEIARLCQQAQIPYHCDASQWVGKMPLGGLSDCGYVSACAHKFGGPKGQGFLLLPEGEEGCHILYGGAQEALHRAGTEDVAGVMAMLAALESAAVGEAELRDAFIGWICHELPGARVVGIEADRLWNTVSLVMPQFQSVRWIRRMERAGFLLSAGSACATGKSTVSHVLSAMGLETAEAGRVLRISSGVETTAEDWQALADALLSAWGDLQREAQASNSQVISID
ncbi:aminotransferase class V-fold PLP-dependent enzyme [Coraliomargarita algicola]|uniref:Aminotransferase class V-fold PLP-dependent enzyme n=1 Tax=Coraliomargarita algicola TaxID=3092156 RepID=A0ABZ0RFU1_9BACT|nr:aminotransferase class V-fold PLP-dependent enzyme [Coraliomargarita sp. J2-16]WPJ93953.1 aminotransferase class V-fold PLP-dependent enzyme [Coraliomargarita sp. J2-16]